MKTPDTRLPGGSRPTEPPSRQSATATTVCQLIRAPVLVSRHCNAALSVESPSLPLSILMDAMIVPEYRSGFQNRTSGEIVGRVLLAGWVARTRPLAGPLSPRGPQPVIIHARRSHFRAQWAASVNRRVPTA
jgi:hypothetical protein